MLCFVLQITNTPVQYGRFRGLFSVTCIVRIV